MINIRNLLLMMVVMTALSTSITAVHIGAADAQVQTESSGDLTAPEGDSPFGGDNVGTYTIGLDREGLRVQVNMDLTPTSGNAYQAWLVDNATDTDLALGQLTDNALADTLQSTNDTSQYNLIVVTEEPVDDQDPARDSAAVVAGAELGS
jgi:hypothetical protein